MPCFNTIYPNDRPIRELNSCFYGGWPVLQVVNGGDLVFNLNFVTRPGGVNHPLYVQRTYQQGFQQQQGGGGAGQAIYTSVEMRTVRSSEPLQAMPMVKEVAPSAPVTYTALPSYDKGQIKDQPTSK